MYMLSGMLNFICQLAWAERCQRADIELFTKMNTQIILEESTKLVDFVKMVTFSPL